MRKATGFRWFSRHSFRWLALSVPAFVASTSAAAERESYSAWTVSPSIDPPASLAAAPLAAVTAVDEKRGIPSFLWEVTTPGARAPRSPLATPESAARFHLARHAARYGLTSAALATAEVERVLDIGRGGIVVVLHQRVDGVEVIQSRVKVLLDRKSLGLVAIAGNLHAGGVSSKKRPAFVLDEIDAAGQAFSDLYGTVATRGDFTAAAPRAPYLRFDLAPGSAAGGLAELHDALRVKRVYYPLPDKLVPAYYVEVDANDSRSGKDDAYAYVIAADDGRLLQRRSLTHNDTFNYRVWADTDGDFRPQDGPLADFTPHPTGIPDGSYPGFVLPNLIPIDGLNTNSMGAPDPWLPSGATVTTGNNSDAYTSTTANGEHFHTGDLRATVTSPSTFDRVYDTAKAPQSSAKQEMASAVELFYTTNWLHDFWYDSGYDEKAGNAQDSNYGRGGLEGDAMQAQAQAGAPKARNNSDMEAFSDGKSPVMHMFVWDGRVVVPPTLSIDGGPSLQVGIADFGSQVFDVSGDVELVDDGSGTTTDACQTIPQDLTGKIALLYRGTCTFKQKTANAFEAGAAGVIVADNMAGEAPFEMGSERQPKVDITIGTLMISKSDGDALKAQLGSGAVTAHMTRTAATVERDGSIDNSIVAHEWGHSLHLRQVDCISTICDAESEGWADTDALLMVIRQGDDLGGTFALAQYAAYANEDSQDPGYFGIRRYPYSTDMNKDPLTFKDIQKSQKLPSGPPISMGLLGVPNSEVHNTGEVWALMLFESYVALLQKTSPAYTFDQAHRAMADYVEGGLTMAPTDPTITEQRDAVMAAALAASPADYTLLAKAFAKRGAGACAVSPDRTSETFDGVVESYDDGASVALSGITLDDSVKSCDHDGYLDEGETGKVTVTVTNTGWAPLEGAKGKVVTVAKDLVFPHGATFDVPTLAPRQSAKVGVDVALAPALGADAYQFPLTIQISSDDACVLEVPGGAKLPKGVVASLSFAASANVDEKHGDSAFDDVETKDTTWTIASVTGNLGTSVWSRQVAGGSTNHVWHGADYGAPSDTALETPSIAVSKTAPFVMSFKQRYKFEVGTDHKKTIDWDGGVLEVSIDGGATWQDASRYADPHYNVAEIGEPGSGATQALVGRPGYGGVSASWPEFDLNEVNFGLALAGETVKLRFRLSSDDDTGAPGMDIDDITLTGADNTPFSRFVADAQKCTKGGGGGGGAGGEGGGGAGGGSSRAILSPTSGCSCRIEEGGHDAPASPWLSLALPALAAAAMRLRRRN